tara:strand:- start:593 stop:823 length:231 start_codon:yes stop_codon:yes gene_type:complete
MRVGDLVKCVGSKPDEPAIGEFGVVVKSQPERDLYVAFVPNRGRGRIWKEDWETIVESGVLVSQDTIYMKARAKYE